MKDSETSIRHEFVTISLRREGVIDCCDLSFFQLSLLGKEGGGNLKYAWCHPFYRFFFLRSSLIIKTSLLALLPSEIIPRLHRRALTISVTDSLAHTSSININLLPRLYWPMKILPWLNPGKNWDTLNSQHHIWIGFFWEKRKVWYLLWFYHICMCISLYHTDVSYPYYGKPS